MGSVHSLASRAFQTENLKLSESPHNFAGPHLVALVLRCKSVAKGNPGGRKAAVQGGSLHPGMW